MSLNTDSDTFEVINIYQNTTFWLSVGVALLNQNQVVVVMEVVVYLLTLLKWHLAKIDFAWNTLAELDLVEDLDQLSDLG